MSEQTQHPIDDVVDGAKDVASAWIQAGARLGQTALSVAADGLQATAEAIAKLADDLEDEVDRAS